MKLDYTKRNIIRLLKSSAFLKERIPLSDNVGIIIEKNAWWPTRYTFGAYLGDRIVLRIEKNNYDVAIDELHRFLVEHSLIPKTLADRFEEIDISWIWESPFKIKSSIGQFKEEDIARKQRASHTLTGSDRNAMLGRIETQALEILPKLCTSNLTPSEFSVTASGGTIAVYSGDRLILSIKESTARWKRILFSYLMSVPERIRTGLPAAEAIQVNYDGNKDFTILIHDLAEIARNIDDKKPFELCDKEDWFVSRPSLLCWMEDLLGGKNVHCIDGLIGF